MKPQLHKQSQKLLAILMFGVFFAVQGIAMSIGYAGANQDALLQRRIRQSVTVEETPAETPVAPSVGGDGGDGGGYGGDGDDQFTGLGAGSQRGHIDVSNANKIGCERYQGEEKEACKEKLRAVAEDFAKWYIAPDGYNRALVGPDGQPYDPGKILKNIITSDPNAYAFLFDHDSGEMVSLDSEDRYNNYYSIVDYANGRVTEQYNNDAMIYNNQHGVVSYLGGIKQFFEDHPYLTATGATLGAWKVFGGNPVANMIDVAKYGYNFVDDYITDYSTIRNQKLSPVVKKLLDENEVLGKNPRQVGRLMNEAVENGKINWAKMEKLGFDMDYNSEWKTQLDEIVEKAYKFKHPEKAAEIAKDTSNAVKNANRTLDAFSEGLKTGKTMKDVKFDLQLFADSASAGKKLKGATNAAEAAGAAAAGAAGVALALSLIPMAFGEAFIGGVEQAYEFCSEIDQAANMGNTAETQNAYDENHSDEGRSSYYNHEAVSQVYNKKLGIDAEYGNLEDYSSKAMEKALNGELPD